MGYFDELLGNKQLDTDELNKLIELASLIEHGGDIEDYTQQSVIGNDLNNIVRKAWQVTDLVNNTTKLYKHISTISEDLNLNKRSIFDAVLDKRIYLNRYKIERVNLVTIEVIHLESGLIRYFKSVKHITQTIKELSNMRSDINRCLKGKRLTVKGYRFNYANNKQTTKETA